MDNKQKEEILKSMINVEFKPELVERETVNLSLFDTLPLPDLAALGPAFSSRSSVPNRLRCVRPVLGPNYIAGRSA